MKKTPRSLMQMLNGGDLIDPTELAKALRVSRPTVYSWVRKGSIPFIKLGELVRFDPTEISIWIKARRQGPTIRCPYGDEGITIGRDFDAFQECGSCPVRQECCVLATQRKAG